MIKNAEFVMDMTSFTVSDLEGEWKEKFLTHVKSGDFFEVDKHPVAKLEIEKQLDKEKPGVQVINASISGDTTSGGRSRLPALLKRHQPSHVVIELGGNDALRGLPLAMTQDNLTAMTRASKAAGARVLIAGMQVPPNYGRQYSEDFAKLFATVAKAENVALVPFLLAGVADGPDAERLFQPDRIHPTSEAQPRMLGNVWPVLRPLLRS